jgi:hypothetical protein
MTINRFPGSEFPAQIGGIAQRRAASFPHLFTRSLIFSTRDSVLVRLRGGEWWCDSRALSTFTPAFSIRAIYGTDDEKMADNKDELVQRAKLAEQVCFWLIQRGIGKTWSNLGQARSHL